MNLQNIFCLLFVLFAQLSLVLSEPFTIAIGLAIASSSGAYYFRCKFQECCNDDYVPYNINALQDSLKSSLFGQPLAMEIFHILQGHKNSLTREGHKKALSISMNGWPGTGKNYVAEFIAKSLFKNGMQSKYVKLYIGRNHFPNKNKVEEYKKMLQEEVRALVKSCDRALIIIDEVHDIPAGVLDVLKPFMDYHDKVDGVSYGNVIFLFLSNVNGNEIAKHLMKLNKDRDALVLADFDRVLSKGSYKSEGGFREAEIVYSQLIDHYIPFLPLEQHHVEKCVQAEFSNVGKHFPSEEEINAVMAIISYGPPEMPSFANAGCKRIRNQVSYMNQKFSRP